MMIKSDKNDFDINKVTSYKLQLFPLIKVIASYFYENYHIFTKSLLRSMFYLKVKDMSE